MKTNSEGAKRKKQNDFVFYVPSQWVAYFTQLIVEGVTNVVVTAITVVVTILVVFGGLWLAYVYLPLNIFYIILVVLTVDIILGILLRSIFIRR